MSSIVSYSCPHCRAGLEVRPGAWQGWMRCPACRRVSLPPEPPARPRSSNSSPWARARHDPHTPPVQKAPAESAAPPEELLAFRTAKSVATSPARLIFITGFALSLFMLLIGFLDQKTQSMMIFGFLAVVFFLLLLRTTTVRSHEGEA